MTDLSSWLDAYRQAWEGRDADAAAALFTLVALAGAVGLPDLAGAQDAPEGDKITVTQGEGGKVTKVAATRAA